MALTHQPDPEVLVHDFGTWALCLNRNQDLLGRCYLLLRRPCTDPMALSAEELQALWRDAAKAKAALTRLFHPDHWNYAFLMNVDPQVHFHVIPRYRSSRTFHGAEFADPKFGGHYPLGPDRALDPSSLSALRSAMAREIGR